MQHTQNTITQLSAEIQELRRRNSELEALLADSKEREENIRTVAEKSLDAVIISDQDGNIVYWNKAATGIFGYASEEALGNPITMLISDEALGRYNYGKESVLTSGSSLFPKQPIEGVAIRKDGRRFHAEFIVSNWKIRDTYYFGGSLRDISEQKRAEEKLIKSEEQFRAISETSLDAIIITDQKGNIVFWNSAATDIFGYDAKEALDKPVTMLMPQGAVMEKYNKAKENVLERGASIFGKKPKEIIARRKDGSIFPVESSMTNWEIGDSYYFGGIFRDISERKRTERELITTKDFLDNIYNTTPDVILVSDEKGYVISVNKAVEKMFGFKQKDLIGKHASEFYPDDEKHTQAGFKAMIGLKKKGFVKNMGVDWIKKDGSLCPAGLNITMLQDRDENRLGSVATIRDISERRQHEKALRDREERFRSIAESSPDAIFISDCRGQILYANKAVERIYGYAAGELMGKSVEILESEKERETYRRARENYKDSHSTFLGKIGEGMALHKNGREFPVEVSTSSWKIDDELFFSGIARDVSRRKKMEEQLRRSHDDLEKKVEQRTAALREANDKLKVTQEYLKKFAGMLLSAREEERKNISTALHDELGSMALSVNSRISIAKDDVKDGNKNAALEALEQSQAALRMAIEDLRRLAVDLRPPNLEIMGLSAALADFLKKAKKHNSLEIHFINELGNRKIADDRAIVIYRVTQEAITNTTKHAKAKNVTIRLYADKTNINLEITDDGVGFNQNKAPRLKSPVKIGIEGMRERVESLGGKFIITAAPRQGTRIKAALPKK
jgi:PAS domain S-box-containing protein